jgi:hypothetical protein
MTTDSTSADDATRRDGSRLSDRSGSTFNRSEDMELSAKIMNLRREKYPHNLSREDVLLAYRMGYRDARRDAAELADADAAELAALRKDAERYRWWRAQVQGVRALGSARPAHFGYPSTMELPPVRGDIMRGSVAAHFDRAVDAAMAARK